MKTTPDTLLPNIYHYFYSTQILGTYIKQTKCVLCILSHIAAKTSTNVEKMFLLRLYKS